MASKPKVLITGVAGFIGSNLADRLVKEGYAVVGVDNLSYGIMEQVPKEVEFHKFDIRSKEIYQVFEGVDYVFHLAAKNSLLDCQNDPVETMDINVAGTANVFEAAKRAKVKRLMYAESSAVEEGEKRLKGFYAISKLADGWIADGYRAASGMDIVGLRYFNVYGPRQDYRRTLPPIMSKLIITFLTDKQPVVFEGDEDNKRDFVYIGDLNDFHLICLTDDRVSNKTFKLGSGRTNSIKEIYDTLKKILGVNPEPIIKPRMEGDVPVVTLADISEAKNLGWTPKTSLEDGLRAMVEYIKEEMAKGAIK